MVIIWHLESSWHEHQRQQGKKSKAPSPSPERPDQSKEKTRHWLKRDCSAGNPRYHSRVIGNSQRRSTLGLFGNGADLPEARFLLSTSWSLQSEPASRPASNSNQAKKKRKEKKRKRNTRLKTKLQLICLSEAPDASSTVGANSIEITFVGSVGAISYSISHQRSADAAGLTAQAGEFRRQAICIRTTQKTATPLTHGGNSINLPQVLWCDSKHTHTHTHRTSRWTPSLFLIILHPPFACDNWPIKIPLYLISLNWINSLINPIWNNSNQIHSITNIIH